MLRIYGQSSYVNDVAQMILKEIRAGVFQRSNTIPVTQTRSAHSTMDPKLFAMIVP